MINHQRWPPNKSQQPAALRAAAERHSHEAVPSKMNVSSRTPEGSPNHCPLCGKDVMLEPSQAGDGTCPNCGHLLWWFHTRLADRMGVDASQITASTSFVNDLGADSLDVVEFVMELEDEFDLSIPDDAARKIKTIGDAIRYLREIQSGDTPT